MTRTCWRGDVAETVRTALVAACGWQGTPNLTLVCWGGGFFRGDAHNLLGWRSAWPQPPQGRAVIPSSLGAQRSTPASHYQVGHLLACQLPGQCHGHVLLDVPSSFLPGLNISRPSKNFKCPLRGGMGEESCSNTIVSLSNSNSFFFSILSLLTSSRDGGAGVILGGNRTRLGYLVINTQGNVSDCQLAPDSGQDVGMQ